MLCGSIASGLAEERVTAKPAVDDRPLPMSVAGTWRRCPNVGFQTLAAMRRASGDANDVLRTSMLSSHRVGQFSLVLWLWSNGPDRSHLAPSGDRDAVMSVMVGRPVEAIEALALETLVVGEHDFRNRPTHRGPN
jgi:hypothetical protein